MYEITQRTVAPYRSVCLITCEWSNGTATRASGVVVGPNDVLTAHHVVYDATHGGYPTSVSIAPAADTTPYDAPLGSWTDVISIDTRSANWDAYGNNLLGPDEAQYDLALLGLRSAIGTTTGVIEASPRGSDGTAMMVGYPGRGTGMMAQSARADADSEWSIFDLNAALGPGASGSPLLQETAAGTRVVGILSSGDAALTTTTYAGLFGAGNYLWLLGAMASNDGGQRITWGYGLRQPQAPAGITGTTGDDTLTGGAGPDIFLGSRGNDTFDGGPGLDTVSYTGPRSSYQLSKLTGGYSVDDTMGARDHRDLLLNIERIEFADVALNLGIAQKAARLPTPQLKLLQELYVAFFNRMPEADGLAYWIDSALTGMQVSQMADAFYAAAVLYPTQTGYSSAMSHADFVNHIYRNTLGRTSGADAEGLAYWSGALAAGTETRGSLVSAILASAHSFKGHATWGWVPDLLDNKAAVAQWFAVEQGMNYRTPEASIAATMALSTAVTPFGTTEAVALIGLPDTFSLV